MNYQTKLELIERLRNDEKLIPTSEIEIVSSESGMMLRLRRYPDVQVFPHIQLTNVIELLIKERLWTQAAIDVTVIPSVGGRITIFGVPLGRAFKEATKRGQRGLQKSRFTFSSYNSKNGSKLIFFYLLQ